jgi:hypothetical protein
MMTYTAIPQGAVILARKRGPIVDPGGPFDGKPGEIRWYRLVTGNQDKHYIEVIRDGVRVLRKQATGRNVAKWKAAYDDLATIIGEES